MDYDTTQNRRTYLKTLTATAVALPASSAAVRNARATNPREVMKEGIREKLVELWDDDAQFDCANAYITAAAHAAEDNSLPLTFRFWNASGGHWEYHNLSDYASAADFADTMRSSMTAVTLIDNTISRDWDDLEAGDLILYDLRHQNSDNYTGHTRGIVGRDCNTFDIVQGTLPPELSREDMSKEKLRTQWEGPVEMKGRELDWDLVFQNGDSGWETGGGISAGCGEDDTDDGSDDDDWWDDDDGTDDGDDGWNDDDGDDGNDETGFSVPGFTLPAVASAVGGAAVLNRMREGDDSDE